MNFSPAFLHGEQVLAALVFAGLMTLIGGPLLLYIWLWYTKVSELKLTIGYLILMAGLCVMFGLVTPASSILSLTAAGLGFILSLPWSGLAAWALSKARGSSVSDREIALLMMLSAGINAVLLYLVAVKMRRKIE